MGIEESKEFFQDLMREVYRLHGSDLHLIPGCFPSYRDSSGQLKPLPYPMITKESTHLMSKSLLGDRTSESWDEDISVQCEKPDSKQGTFRGRANIFRSYDGINISVRIIKDEIPSMEKLLIPYSVQQLISCHHGLVLFTAPTGNGKSTSLASIIDSINFKYSRRIITIEDPVEYIFANCNSLISQREVGIHCESFYAGLKAALREDPDVIMVGEMRDAETVKTALMAAETGHLVFSTLHAPNVTEAVDRMLQYFERDQNLVRSQLANSFLAIVAQCLLPSKTGGRIAAFEVLLHNTATANVIRTGAMHTIRNYMTKNDGMQLMADSIDSLRLRGFIEP